MQKENRVQKTGYDIEKEAVRKDVSSLRDHLSAYVANIDKTPVIIERYGKPVAAIVSYRQYKEKRDEKVRPKRNPNWSNRKEYEAHMAWLENAKKEDVTWEDFRGILNPERKRYTQEEIELLKQEAWESMYT